jgi:hypothetical protein
MVAWGRVVVTGAVGGWGPGGAGGQVYIYPTRTRREIHTRPRLASQNVQNPPGNLAPSGSRMKTSPGLEPPRPY